MRTYEIAPLLILATAGAAMAQTPEGVALPRGLTADERAHVERTPLIATGAERGVAGAPTGPVVCPPEYAPCAGIIIAWEGPTSWKDILANMTVQITTRPESQGAKVWIAVDSSTEGSSTASLLDSRGADLSRVEFVVRQTDSIWMRDYGPRFIYEGGVRAIVDHTYNRPRFADNLFPDYFSSTNGYEQYQIPLVHGGGNFHLAADQDAWATELIQDENPSLSAAQIVDLWRDFQNLETELTDALPSFIDATQHIDMWMIPVSDNTIIVSDWPSQPGTTQDSVCDQFAIDAQNLGYTVVRAPAVALSGTHYTYTNAVIVNDLVLMPVYSNASIRSLNGQALSAWESARGRDDPDDSRREHRLGRGRAALHRQARTGKLGRRRPGGFRAHAGGRRGVRAGRQRPHRLDERRRRGGGRGRPAVLDGQRRELPAHRDRDRRHRRVQLDDARSLFG